MEPAELMVRVARVFDAMGLAYAVGGSMASMRYGEPRFANDIDIVVDLPASRVEEFVSHFPTDDFYPESGLKVDVILPPPTRMVRRNCSGRGKRRRCRVSACGTRRRRT